MIKSIERAFQNRNIIILILTNMYINVYIITSKF